MVHSVHRSEKILRAQSAAVIAQSAAVATEEANKSSAPEQSNLAKSATSSGNPPTTPLQNTRVETPGAIYEGGKIQLVGNPLATTPEIICPHCRLPRLHYPITGKGSRPPDLTKEYCMLYPFVSKAGHDIYGNPFATDGAKTKKERELIRQQQKDRQTEKDNTPGSQDAAATPPETIKLNTGNKPASYIPWHTCPTCKRSLLITRFAQHLEKCLGISGRASSRNAMAKLSSQNGNTPLGSRMGTPQPSATGKRSPSKRSTAGGDDDDDGEADESPIKKKKKSNYVKKADRERLAKEAADKEKEKTKIKRENSTADKRPPSTAGGGGEKRAREDDANGEEGSPRKKNRVEKKDGVDAAEPA